MRAANGHPAPFDLKYLEIGNENGGSYYDPRYTLFCDAIKAKYPAIRLISPVWGSPSSPTSRPVETQDDHYYSGPATFSDVVELASYAPLFANVNGIQWHPDLIYSDGSRNFGTPSYYVQQLFSNHRGDAVLPMTITYASLGLSATQTVQVIFSPTALVHRYSFSETSGTTVADSVGGPLWNGTLPNSGTFGGGQLALAAASSQYVQLPAGILSNYAAVTIETWVTFPDQLPNNCFFFGFGNTNGSSGTNYIFSAPRARRIAITSGTYSGEQNAYGNLDFSLDECRIYGGALQTNEIAATQALGPRQLLSNTSPLIGTSFSGGNLTSSWPLASAGFTLMSRTNTVLGDWTAVTSPAPQSVGSQWQITIPVSGDAVLQAGAPLARHGHCD